MFHRKKRQPQRYQSPSWQFIFFRFEIEQISKLDVNPVNFKDFLYQPEKDAQTGASIYQREDHNLRLKRIIASLREGNIQGIDLCCMRDALHDLSTG